MEYMQIKGLERAVSKIVLGSAGGTPGFRPDQRDQYEEILDIYYEAGGNMIDTAIIYGTENVSEDFIAAWVHKRKTRDKIYVTNKCCSPFKYRKGGMDESRSRVHPELITDDLIHSLDRMDFDHFDCYLIHRDNKEVPVADLMDCLEYHCKKGKILSYGVSNWSTQRVKEAIAYCEKMHYQGISVNEPSYSLATVPEPRWPNTVYITDEDARMFTNMGLPVFSFSPIGAGYFAGVFFREDAVINEATRKAYLTDQNKEKYRRAGELADKYGTDRPSIALSYIFSQDLLLAPIIGPKTPDECRSCLNAFKLRLSPAEIEYLSLRSDTQ